MSGKQKIETHINELKDIGIDIESLSDLPSVVSQPHRDDHYMFIIQLSGLFVLDLDFNEVTYKDACVGYVTPGQVHRYTNIKNCKGWLLFVDVEFVPKQYRDVFDTFLNSRQIVSVQKDDQLFKLSVILEKWFTDNEAPLKSGVLSSLIHSISGMIASKMLCFPKTHIELSTSKYILANKFKQFVKEKFREEKQVKAYAALLNITPIYLNEVMNEITGFAASYWIQQEVLLEAKRLLYYSGMDINEIAYELGYEDSAYFSRFFKKNAGVTASDFRSRKP